MSVEKFKFRLFEKFSKLGRAPETVDDVMMRKMIDRKASEERGDVFAADLKYYYQLVAK